MRFLEPFSRQRETIGNLDDIDVNEEEERDGNIAAIGTQVIDELENAEEVTVSPAQTKSTPTPTRLRCSSNLNRPSKRKQDESATGVLMKYLVGKQRREETSLPAVKDSTEKLQKVGSLIWYKIY
nr:uncharacterized protein LOC111418312 [Onthophagus taurus]